MLYSAAEDAVAGEGYAVIAERHAGVWNSPSKPVSALYLSAAVCVLTACVPVASFVGRPAAVIPKDSQRVGFTAGVVYCEERLVGGEKDFMFLPYGYALWELPQGRRTDLRFAFSGIAVEKGFGQAQAVWRAQLAGQPLDNSWRGAGFPLDLSLEAGAGATSESHHDVHLGINCSFALGEYAPYVSYRHHWGTKQDKDVEYQFLHQEIFVGLALVDFETTVAVELFHGWSSDLDFSETEAAYGTWGLNLVVSGIWF